MSSRASPGDEVRPASFSTIIASWAFGLPRRLLSSGTALWCFLATVLTPPLTQEAAPPAASCWPMPPPFSWEVPAPPQSGRGRARWRRLYACRLWVNCLVVACSHLALRGARICLASARSGRPLTILQSQVVEHFVGLTQLMLRADVSPGPREVKIENMHRLLDSVCAVAVGVRGFVLGLLSAALSAAGFFHESGCSVRRWTLVELLQCCSIPRPRSHQP